MKKIAILTILFCMTFCISVKAQEAEYPKFEYKPLTEFSGDTVAFLFHNFYVGWDYTGNTVAELLELITLPYDYMGDFTISSEGTLTRIAIYLKDYPRHITVGASPPLMPSKGKIVWKAPEYGIEKYNPRYMWLDVWLDPPISLNDIPEDVRRSDIKCAQFFMDKKVSIVRLYESHQIWEEWEKRKSKEKTK